MKIIVEIAPKAIGPLILTFDASIIAGELDTFYETAPIGRIINDETILLM